MESGACDAMGFVGSHIRLEPDVAYSMQYYTLVRNLYLLCDSDKTKLEADWHFFSAVLPVYSHLEICFFSHAGGNLYLHGELVLLFCNSLYA